MVDVVIIGSGASAVNAAYPLVEAGFAVRMLDYGNRDTVYRQRIPAGSFSEIRHTDPNQHRYFLGDHFEGIGFGYTGAGAQLTPPRQYVLRDTQVLTPVVSKTFFPIESLALGGLAGAWGAGCPQFGEADLGGFPLSRTSLDPHYEAVAERIGISGAHDDLLPFLGNLKAMQPPVEVDTNGQSILQRYQKIRLRLNGVGFYLGRPRLAMLSEHHRGRGPTQYYDMEFWTDTDKSVYRPQWTVDELRSFPNFDYRESVFVHEFVESRSKGVEVRAKNKNTGDFECHRARLIVLAAGTLGTTRIVLRSFGLYQRRVPLVCNPHTYAAMLNVNTLGKPGRDARHSLAQLCFVYAPGGNAHSATVGHLYSYRSLLTFRLAKDSPLPFRETLKLIRLVLPSLSILIIQHQDNGSHGKYCLLSPDREGGADRLEIQFTLSPDERKAADQTERAILSSFRKLGCLCFRRVRPEHAASVHYAGTFPMSAREQELTTDLDGRLRGTTRVYLADGSVFPSLPSKGLTFTMMANANRVGCHLREVLRS